MWFFRPSDQGPPPIDVPWGAGDAARGVGMIVAGAAATILFVWPIRGADGPLAETVNAVAVVGLTGLLLAGPWLFAVRKYGAPWQSLGLAAPSGAFTLALSAACMAASIGFFVAFVSLADRFGPDILVPEPMDAERLGSGAFRVVNVAVAVLVGPFAEEVFFRGFLLAALIAPLGAFRAAAVSSALFAVGHVDAGVIAPFFVTGLLLSWLYLKTRSVWPPMLAHAGQNTVAIIGLLASG